MRIQLLFITVLFLALQAFAEIAEFRDPPEHCDDCHRGVWLAFKSFETENQEDNDLKYNAHFFLLVASEFPILAQIYTFLPMGALCPSKTKGYPLNIIF